MLAAFAALHFTRDAKIIVHTWKIPGHSDQRWTAGMYDHILDYLIRKADLVVVASMKQLTQLEESYPSLPRYFAPVTVDCRFWSPSTDREQDLQRLASLDVKHGGFVLTVGDSDRDEKLGLSIARGLGWPYVRVTKDKRQIELLRRAEQEFDLRETTKVLVDVSDEDLRALYRSAFVVSLPTVTRTNPAGLSALTEAMACAAVVLAPRDISEGYITDHVNGVTFDTWDADKAVNKILQFSPGELTSMGTMAREFAIANLNSQKVAEGLRKALLGGVGQGQAVVRIW